MEDSHKPAFNTNPMHWARRQLRKSEQHDSEAQAHVLLYFEKIKEMAGDDPRQQAIASSACVMYGEVVKLQHAIIKCSTSGDEYNALLHKLCKAQKALVDMLRMAGLVSKDGKTKTGKRSASVFTRRRVPDAPEPVATLET